MMRWPQERSVGGSKRGEKKGKVLWAGLLSALLIGSGAKGEVRRDEQSVRAAPPAAESSPSPQRPREPSYWKLKGRPDEKPQPLPPGLRDDRAFYIAAFFG